MKTDYDTENRTFEIQKPKPNRTTKKTEILVRYGSVRFLVYGKNVPTPSRCGAQVRWSTAKVKVMHVRADGPVATKDERWDLTEGPEKPGD